MELHFSVFNDDRVSVCEPPFVVALNYLLHILQLPLLFFLTLLRIMAMVALFFIYFLPKHVYFESFFENSQVKTSAFPTYAGVDQLEMFIIFFFSFS